MAATRSGPTGLTVLSPVVEEDNVVIVHAPILRLQTVVKTAQDWDKLQNHGNVTHLDARVKTMHHKPNDQMNCYSSLW